MSLGADVLVNRSYKAANVQLTSLWLCGLMYKVIVLTRAQMFSSFLCGFGGADVLVNRSCQYSGKHFHNVFIISTLLVRNHMWHYRFIKLMCLYWPPDNFLEKQSIHPI